MSIAESLIDDETIEFTSTKHWIAPLRDSVPAVLLLVGAYLINWLGLDREGGVFGWIGNLLDLIRSGMIVVAIFWIINNVLVWRTAEFALTNLRVIREEGVIARRSSATLLSGISDVKANVGILGKTAGYGDLEILTQSGGAGVDRFKSITQPEAFRNAILTHKMADVRSAASKAAPAAPAAPPAGPAATASASSAEAAAALASLADLRDRALITPEEYEAKRAEVLARI